jgi:hypothetical protein
VRSGSGTDSQLLEGLRPSGAKRQGMLLKRRPPRIENRPEETRKGFEHLDTAAIAVLRWLKANKVEFVLVGPVAEAIRGRAGARGPVSIVPAPYRRNLERLAQALDSAGACIRLDGAGITGEADTTPTKMTAEKLARGQLWTLRCGTHDLDVEGHAPGITSYQDLLYEASRFDVAADVCVEVASPEDTEHYAHIRRTGSAPEIKITRATTSA